MMTVLEQAQSEATVAVLEAIRTVLQQQREIMTALRHLQIDVDALANRNEEQEAQR